MLTVKKKLFIIISIVCSAFIITFGSFKLKTANAAEIPSNYDMCWEIGDNDLINDENAVSILNWSDQKTFFEFDLCSVGKTDFTNSGIAYSFENKNNNTITKLTNTFKFESNVIKTRTSPVKTIGSYESNEYGYHVEIDIKELGAKDGVDVSLPINAININHLPNLSTEIYVDNFEVKQIAILNVTKGKDYFKLPEVVTDWGYKTLTFKTYGNECPKITLFNSKSESHVSKIIYNNGEKVLTETNNEECGSLTPLTGEDEGWYEWSVDLSKVLCQKVWVTYNDTVDSFYVLSNGEYTSCDIKDIKFVVKKDYIVTNDKIAIVKGEESSLNPYLSNNNEATFSYESSDSNIVSVDNNGKLIGVNTGTATISITSNTGLSKNVTVGVADFAIEARKTHSVDRMNNWKKYDYVVEFDIWNNGIIDGDEAQFSFCKEGENQVVVSYTKMLADHNFGLYYHGESDNPYWEECAVQPVDNEDGWWHWTLKLSQNSIHIGDGTDTLSVITNNSDSKKYIKNYKISSINHIVTGQDIYKVSKDETVNLEARAMVLLKYQTY